MVSRGTHTLGIHSLTVLSLEAEATRSPDGEKSTENMASYMCIIEWQLMSGCG